MQKWSAVVALAALGLAGCSVDGSTPRSSGGDAGKSENSGGGNAGGSGPRASGGIGGSGANAGGGGSENLGGTAAAPFPNGGQQYKTIVNIVSPEAVKQIEQTLKSSDPGDDYTIAAREFFALYPDEYDFLYFILDHEVEEANAYASAQTVNRSPIPGTGIERATKLHDYGSSRLKSAVGSQAMLGSMPPFAHETLHYFANHLDKALGFGKDREYDWGAHWGPTGVFGQLGGFDSNTLRCANPAGATPPACTPESSGRIRYKMGGFGPHINHVPYAPLELYLMGLIPNTEVPASFPLLQDATYVPVEGEPNTATVEASGISQIQMSAIIARHGKRALASEAERRFTAAFVLVTEKPATSEFLEQVVEWQEIFGNHRTTPNSTWRSFATLTGDRATLETRIGRRRIHSDPPLPPRIPKTCDVYAQDCGRPDVGCYHRSPEPKCLASAGRKNGETCKFNNDCVPGSTCISGGLDATLKCVSYCDPKDESSAKACNKLCPGQFVTIQSEDLSIVGAMCRP